MANKKMASYEEVLKIAETLKGRTQCQPKILIICGTGLGNLVDVVENKEIIHYKDIPGFVVSTVDGHKGLLIFGTLRGVPVVCMKGRFHLYEGYEPAEITLPVRVAKVMGVTHMIVTNACGGLNAEYNVGDLMIINDHINLPGLAFNHPLVGKNIDEFGTRFPAMNKAYNRDLRQLAKQAAADVGLTDIVHEGVYAVVSGPSYETCAECRFLRMAGADVVGMSTAHEVIVAVHCGIQCVGISLVTNKCVMDLDSESEANHDEVMDAGNARSADAQNLVGLIVERIGA